MKRALNPSLIKAAKGRERPYKLADGGGLYLLITPSGSKLWRYKFRLMGKELTFGIGQFPDVGLASAREEHELARQLVAQGLNPVGERKSKKQAEIDSASNSFEAVARRWMKENAARWSTYYARQVETTLSRDVFPLVGKHNVAEVTAASLRPVIQAVAERKQPPGGKKLRTKGAATVALLIRQWCSQVFRYAIVHGLAESDPTYSLRGLISRPKVQHHRYLASSEVHAFLSKFREFNGTTQVRIAIELLLLTFVRTGELRKAEWQEFDLQNRLWRIPPSKMKMGRAHVVPLSLRAIELLEELKTVNGTGALLFPNRRSPGEPMSMTTINRALERLGFGGRLSGHGFRGTASTYLNEVGYPAHIIEKQLAHDRLGGVEGAYNHAQFLPERAKMMQSWSEFLSADQGNVVAFKKTG